MNLDFTFVITDAEEPVIAFFQLGDTAQPIVLDRIQRDHDLFVDGDANNVATSEVGGIRQAVAVDDQGVRRIPEILEFRIGAVFTHGFDIAEITRETPDKRSFEELPRIENVTGVKVKPVVDDAILVEVLPRVEHAVVIEIFVQ